MFLNFKWHQMSIGSCVYFYTMQVCLWLVLDSSLVNITDFTLFLTTSKLFLLIWFFYMQVVILAHAICHFLTTSFLLLPYHWPAHCLKVVLLSVPATHFAICQTWSGEVPCARVFAIVLPFLYLRWIVNRICCMSLQVFCLTWFLHPSCSILCVYSYTYWHFVSSIPLVMQPLLEFLQPSPHYLAH